MSWSCEKKSLTSVMLLLCAVFAFFAISACGDSVEADEDVATTQEESSSSVKSLSSKAKSSSSSAKNSSSSKLEYPDSFKPQDKEYPYAGIPRIVIETEYRNAVKDRETEVPAKMQIWGDSSAESEILDLTIRGRGNTSWWNMPKKSYKIEFEKKQSMLGMPKDKDWALIANYTDKSLLKNYVTYQLASWLGAKYAPKSDYVELYLNGSYLGVYLLTETVKKGKNRVNISENAYLAEFDVKQKADDFGFVTKKEKKVTIHYPKDLSEDETSLLKEFIDFLETTFAYDSLDLQTLSQYIDVDDYIFFYWIQEFSKNKDGAFSTSVYFTWEKDRPLSMGPVWDFDLAYGGNYGGDVIANGEWYVRNFYWNRRLFSEDFFVDLVKKYWIENSRVFRSVQDSIYSYKKKIWNSAQNNFKRWNILESTTNTWHNIAFADYDSAVDSLVGWIDYRIRWIDDNLKNIRYDD